MIRGSPIENPDEVRARTTYGKSHVLLFISRAQKKL
jgi:hypothetical protein